jgi:amidase
VTAGFAPIALGTETDGSITQPCGRASLYGLKATIGSISTKGTSPYSPFSDSLGPLAKSPRDIALLFGVLSQKDYTGSLTSSWGRQRVSFVDPDKWKLGEMAADRVHELLKEQVHSHQPIP